MSRSFEELDFRPTEIGALSLRRRSQPVTGIEIYEIKLGDEFLMSSLFTAAEIALAQIGLAALNHTGFDVVVGGLGLGYTAHAVLEDSRVSSLTVIDALTEVIEWHAQGLLPIGKILTADPRCKLVQGDFFAMALSADGFDPTAPGRRFHAVLVDIDHSPRNLLHPRHAALYQIDGLQRLARHLLPDGVFALWSNDPPDAAFEASIANAFATSQTHVVTFDNPLRAALQPTRSMSGAKARCLPAVQQCPRTQSAEARRFVLRASASQTCPCGASMQCCNAIKIKDAGVQLAAVA